MGTDRAPQTTLVRVFDDETIDEAEAGRRQDRFRPISGIDRTL